MTLYHATIPGGPSGIAFAIGETLLFAPADDETLYVVEPAVVQWNDTVTPEMTAFLTAYVIEPRLAALGTARPMARRSA